MRIKRFISFILSAVMVLSICSISVFAVTPETHQNYDIKNENPFAIVIRDAEGNVVETYYQTRQLYVDGTQYTIPANGTLTTYQYDTSIAFFAGFYFTHSDYSGYATTRNRSVTITIRNAPSVGGTRSTVSTHTFSTNEENNTGNAYYISGIQPGCTAISIDKTTVSSRPYYDAVYKNNSASSLTISLLVGRD
ncbi:MAG: hypothetical protein IKV99_02700 [Oscillospiraceae bacterium]|nr:hypothetical protein [Oscillospiraceae bacterium]